ncbi:hypothetical protein, partial [Neisseria meningitidis]|uniref:hypothetical protein n=1 Tax=Neisseria meningitidis TaxID=487 RepID=UPI0021A4EE46
GKGYPKRFVKAKSRLYKSFWTSSPCLGKGYWGEAISTTNAPISDKASIGKTNNFKKPRHPLRS